MINKRNYIFTQVKQAVSELCENASTTYQSSPATFPYLYLTQTDNSGVDYTLFGEECAVRPQIEIHVYTTGTGALLLNDKVFQLADATMISMGFQRIYGVAPKENLTDSKITEQVARYRRLVGSGDTL